MNDQSFQTLEILKFGPGTVIESADAVEAVNAALEEYNTDGERCILIQGHPASGAPFYTFAVIDGEVYQLDKIDERDEAEGVGKESPVVTWDSLTTDQQRMLIACAERGETLVRLNKGDGRSETAVALESLGLVTLHKRKTFYGNRFVKLTDAGREIVQGKDMTYWFGDKT